MMEGKHTPGKLEYNPDDYIIFVTKPHPIQKYWYTIAKIAGNHIDIRNANGEYIVKCWNSHDDLLEVCKRASKAHCLRGTILQHDLIKAIAKAKKCQ